MTNEFSFQQFSTSTSVPAPDRERIWESILRSMGDGVVVVDRDGNVQLTNPAAEKILGAAASPELCAQLPLARALQGEILDNIEVMIRHTSAPEGIRISVNVRPILDESGTVLGGVAVFRSIAAPQAEHEKLQQFSRAVEQSPASVVITDPLGNIEYVNPKFTQVTGYRPQEVIGKNPRILKSGQLSPEYYAQLWSTIRAGKEWRGEFLNRKKSGEEYWEYASISPLTDAQGAITHFIAVKEDITARKRVEEALRQANETLQGVIRTSPLAIITLELDGRVKSWNGAAEQMFGWREAEVLDRPLPTIPEQEQSILRATIERARSGQTLSGFETRWLRRDGSPVEVSIWNAVLRDSQGAVRGFIAVLADISERKRLEERVRQSEKMEAIGTLAGGIAHDFNNLLMIITGYAHELADEMEPDDPMLEEMNQISKAANRAAALTSQLLSFSRRQIVQPRTLYLHNLLAGMRGRLRRTIGDRIRLHTVLQPVGPVKADPEQIEQVLVNLAANARDAMPRGGTLMIRTTEVELGPKDLEGSTDPQPGPYVMLEITDTGCGMDEETRRHLFEPFFTTKGLGRGTGLGLSTIYGIVKQAGGEVRVSSEPQQGTTFQIYLPRIEPAERIARPAPAVQKGANGARTILVVEDEDEVRKTVREMLRRRGYRVLEAGDGDQALQIYRQHAGSIDLVLTDVVMPNMSGAELAQRLAGLEPDTRVLYMSAYPREVIASQEMLEPGTAFIQKPFTAEGLAAKVRAALEAARPR